MLWTGLIAAARSSVLRGLSGERRGGERLAATPPVKESNHSNHPSIKLSGTRWCYSTRLA